MKKTLACGFVALLCGACGSSSSSTSNTNTSTGTSGCTASSATATTSVNLSNFQFSPTCIKLAAGSSVTFTNQDSTEHTVTSDTGQSPSFDSGSLAQNATFKQSFASAGTTTVHCNFHPDMHLTVITQ